MPTYQYACTQCDERLEAVQTFTDAPLTECPACGGRLRKVFSAVGVVFKGSGFYKNDSRSGGGDKPAAKGGEGSDAPSGDKPADKGSDKGTDKSGEKAPAAAPAAAKEGSSSGSSPSAPKSSTPAPAKAG